MRKEIVLLAIAVSAAFAPTTARAQGKSETAAGGNSENPYGSTNSYGAYGYPAAQLAPYQDCLMQVCGSNLSSAFNGFYQFQTGPGTSLLQRQWSVFNEINKLFRKHLAEEAEQTRAIIKAYEANELVSDAKALQSAYRFKLMLSGIALLRIKTDNSGIDIEKTREALASSTMPKEDAERLMKILSKRSGGFTNYPLIEKDFWFYVKTHPPEDVRKQISAIIDESTQLQGQMLDALGGLDQFSGSLAAQRARNERLKSGEMLPRDVETLTQDLHGSRAFGLFVGEGDDHGIAPLHARDAISEDSIKSHRTKLAMIEQALGPNPPADNPAIQAYAVEFEKCKNTMMEAEHFLPSQKVAKEFMEGEKKARADFAANLGSRLSEKSRARLISGMTAAVIKPPMTFEEWRDRLAAQIKDELNSKPINIASNKSMRQVVLASASLIGGKRNASSSEDLASSVRSLCEDLRVNRYPDVAYRLDTFGQFGPMTAKSSPANNWIANHEYGHMASGLFEKDKEMSEKSRGIYKNYLTCLKSAYGEDSKYVEEDWGDFASTTTVQSEPTAHPFCAEITAYDPASFTIRPSPGDDHSSHLFRILHYRLYNGGIPEVCTQALKAQGEEFKGKKCI